MDKFLLVSFGGLLGWFALKLLGLGTWTWQMSISIGVLWHFTTILVLAIICARESLKLTDSHFLERWKNSAQKTSKHALLLTLSMGVWYYVVAPGALEKQKQSQVDQVRQALGNDVAYAALQDEQPELENRSREDILETQMKNLEVFYSPLFFIGLSLLLWLFVGLASAAMMDLIWQRIWS